MKRTWLSIALSLLVLSIAAQNSEQKGSGPLLVLLKNDANYGIIMYNSDGKISVPFVNQGDQPLVIESCKTRSGALTADYTREPIAPGDTDFLHLNYLTLSVGRFLTGATLKSNCRERPTIIIPVVGEVRQPGPDMILSSLNLGAVSQFPIPDGYITLVNRGDEPLIVDSCHVKNYVSPYSRQVTHTFSVTYPTEAIAPGDSTPVKVSLTQPPQDTGSFNAMLTLYYNGYVVDSCHVWVYGVYRK